MLGTTRVDNGPTSGLSTLNWSTRASTFSQDGALKRSTPRAETVDAWSTFSQFRGYVWVPACSSIPVRDPVVDDSSVVDNADLESEHSSGREGFTPVGGAIEAPPTGSLQGSRHYFVWELFY